MSWIKENYEKAAIGGAAIIALGIGAAVLLGGGEETGKAANAGAPSEDVSVAAAARLGQALETRKGEIKVDEIVDAGGRSLGIFVGQRLFAQQDSDTPVDLHITEKPVHEGIPNQFWLKYELDPGYANSAERDPDGDGFSNLEEAKAETSPIDAKDHPALIDKLEAVQVEQFKYRMRWSEFAGEQITIRYRDLANNNFSTQVAPGDVFFDQEPMNKRFKLGQRKNVQDERGMAQDAYEVEDMSPLHKGRTLLLLRRGPENGENEFADSSATLRLAAIGQQDKPFKLQEGESFSLPFDPKAAKKPYRLKSITPEGNGFKLEIEIEGQAETIPLQAQGK